MKKAAVPSTSPEAPKSEGTAPELVEKRLKTWFPDLAPRTLSNLVCYHSELLKFNKTINLISGMTVKSADSTHVADCVFASRLIEPVAIPNQPMYDFGSGNGCPGVIYAALYPTRRVILIDRDQRKLEFCKHVSAAMELKNLSIQIQGVEELAAGSVHNAVARGFAPFSKSLLLVRKQFSRGGKFFHMKGDGWANELAQMPSQIFSHWNPSLLGQYRLPDSQTDMFVVLTEKTSD